jgi:hypothetical protein
MTLNIPPARLTITQDALNAASAALAALAAHMPRYEAVVQSGRPHPEDSAEFAERWRLEYACETIAKQLVPWACIGDILDNLDVLQWVVEHAEVA